MLAKVFGIYRISLGKHYRNVDFLVMEASAIQPREHERFLTPSISLAEPLLWPGTKQIFDLKGSTRNRRAEENNPVLLDENLIERECSRSSKQDLLRSDTSQPTVSLKSPIYVREESKQLVKEAIYNDSQFLADLSTLRLNCSL